MKKLQRASKAIPPKRLAVPVCSGCILLVSFLVLYFTYGKRLLEIVSDYELFKAWLSQFPVPAQLVFVFVRAFQTIVKIIPAEPLEIASGYIWGTFGGFCFCMLGTEAGSLIILFITRKFGIKFINYFMDTSKLNEWSFIKNSKRKYLMLFLIYLVPGTPKDIITYFIGLTNTKMTLFLLITGVARIPAIISSTWCGSTLIDKNYAAFALIFFTITVLSVGGTVLGTKYFNKKREAEKNI